MECAGRTYTATNTIAEIIWEVLQRHATGIEFRERRAGRQLDSHMTWDGFVVTGGVRWADGSGYAPAYGQKAKHVRQYQRSKHILGTAVVDAGSSTVATSTTAERGWTRWARPRCASLAPKTAALPTDETSTVGLYVELGLRAADGRQPRPPGDAARRCRYRDQRAGQVDAPVVDRARRAEKVSL